MVVVVVVVVVLALLQVTKGVVRIRMMSGT